MKKLLFALVLGMALVFALATVASADNGPHGGYNGSTEACASCHRAHQAISADGFLLVAADVWTLCTNCHDGTGAYTNVVNGYYDTVVPVVDTDGKAGWGALQPAQGWGDTGVGLFGGGFVNARMLTDYGNGANEAAGNLAMNSSNAAADMNTSTTSWARLNAFDTGTVAAIGRAVTSTHGVQAAGRTGTVWGSGNISAVPFSGGTFTGATELECTSCHDPHGNAGKQWGSATGAPYPSYRLLRFTPSGSAGFEVAGEVGVLSTSYWNTAMTWSAANGIAAGYNSQTVIPSVAGVMVPDTTVKWYSVNNDPAMDNSVSSYRTRFGTAAAFVPSLYVANFAGRGDYMGRYYGYKRPAVAAAALTVTATSVNGSTRLACYNSVTMTATAADCAGVAATTAFNNQAPHDVLGFWCATCHDRYLAPGGGAPTGSRTTDSGDANYHYRHRASASGATLAGTGTYTCVDCHNAHGTASTASAVLASNASYGIGSVLLKADNRAVCIRCHAGDINFFNVTTSPTAPMIVPVLAGP